MSGNQTNARNCRNDERETLKTNKSDARSRVYSSHSRLDRAQGFYIDSETDVHGLLTGTITCEWNGREISRIFLGNLPQVARAKINCNFHKILRRYTWATGKIPEIALPTKILKIQQQQQQYYVEYTYKAAVENDQREHRVTVICILPPTNSVVQQRQSSKTAIRQIQNKNYIKRIRCNWAWLVLFQRRIIVWHSCDVTFH